VSLALLWIPATIAASLLQTARNLTQRSLTDIIGVVGATQVRFLFGLPFALLFLGLVCLVTARLPPAIEGKVLAFALGGALAQIAATALMLAAMRTHSFAVTTAYTKTEPVQVAIFGALLLGDPLGWGKFAAIIVATIGVIVVSWKPGQKLNRRLGRIRRFGKLDAETVESLIVRVAERGAGRCRHRAEDVDEIVLGHFNAGFSPQDFTGLPGAPGRSDKLRFKPATRVENACATGSAAVHQGIKRSRRARQDRAGGRRRADDATPGPRSARTCSRPPTCPRTATPGGFAGVFGKIAGLFPAPWRPVRCAGDDRRQEPQERRRQSLCADAQGSGLRFLPRREREEPLRRRPLKRTDCSLVSDGAAALVLADTETAKTMKQGGRLPRHRACAGFPADVEARHPPVRGLHGGLAAALAQAGVSSPISPSSRPMTASPSPN
jgi:uncharacterized membrane protein